MKKLFFLLALIIIAFATCKKKEREAAAVPSAPAKLRFVLKLDSTQARLDNIGNLSAIPSDHKAQSPRFNSFGAHYIELAVYDTTGVGRGTVLYITPSVNTTPVTITSGTNSATYTTSIDFSQLPLKSDGEEIFSVPLSDVTPGNYKWFRMSVAYQNYDIDYVINSGTTVGSYTFPSNYNGTGTIASFVGYRTYIGSYLLKKQTVTLNAAKLQGYWGFESSYTLGSTTYTTTPSQGDGTPGATTVVNPLFSTSPIPPGSCLVTGQFVNTSQAAQYLTITGKETSDMVVVVSVSINKSFEWVEHSGDATYNPLNGDTVVNMGLRGLIPIIQP
jgi:hypothetical protein